MKFKEKINKPSINCLKNAKGIPQYDIKGMLRVVEDYFGNIFSAHETRDSITNIFLEQVQPDKDLLNLIENNDLTRAISITELDESICPKNRMPGPDGFSYEYYMTILSDDLLKMEFLAILNNILNIAKTSGVLPSKLTEGVITLIPKKPPYGCIENYRPISLINTDIKILTKILSNRLKPYLANILHTSQFAQPGLDINMLNIQIRDLLYDMQNGVDDAFFVSLDFKSAFDKVKHSFLFKVLERSGFPTTFINVIKALYCNAKSVI